jgi:hypothetical protein
LGVEALAEGSGALAAVDPADASFASAVSITFFADVTWPVSLTASVGVACWETSAPYSWAIGVVGPRIGGAWMTAGVACGSCGTGLRQCAKFCDTCGSRLVASVDTAEYKQVTLLFADVVGSMDTSTGPRR